MGAKKFFFEPGNTVKKTIYSDSALTISALNPQISDADGRYSNNVFLDGIYSEEQQDNTGTATGYDGATLWTKDPIGDVASGEFTPWVSDTIYNIPDKVVGTDDFSYESLTDNNQGNDPISSPSNWGKITFVKAGVLDGVSEIKDTNSLTALIITPTASAVNHSEITNAATGEDPKIAAIGTDPNINLELGGKGTGGVELLSPIVDDAQNELLKFVSTASALNEVTITNGATGNGPTVSATGETNVDLNLASKGTGVVKANIRDLETGLIQTITSVSSTLASTTSVILLDDTTPTITEGAQLLDVIITPRYTDSIIEIEFSGMFGSNGAGVQTITVIDVTGSTTEYATGISVSTGVLGTVSFHTEVPNSGLSANTYRIRWGVQAGTGYVNGVSTRNYGGVAEARLTVKEVRHI